MAATIQAYWYLGVILLLLLGWALFRLLRPRADIQWNKLDSNLEWDPQSKDSLAKIYDYVVGFSDSTIGWYRKRRHAKRYWGVSLRVGALLATAAAGLVPLSKELGMGEITAVWSTVLVAAAGIFVSVDALGGFTSGWVRYMLAQQKVERLRDAFLLDWNALKIAQPAPPDMLDRAKAFLLAVGKVVDDETQEWATEFQNALKEMEKVRKTAAEAERTGAVEVSVKNPQAVTGWTLEIDGSQRGRTSGKSLAVTDVFAGLRKLKAYGQDAQGRTLADEKTVKVQGGAMVAKELELS
jgi:SMODS and SLOG-associating 2TM effector domain 2